MTPAMTGHLAWYAFTVVGRLRQPRRLVASGGLDVEIAAAAAARDVVRVDVRPRGDIRRRPADLAAVLDDRVALRDRAERDLVARRDPLARDDHPIADRQLSSAVDDLERGRDVVSRADHEGWLHWLTPLARKPPSTASTCPVTNDAASEARNTAAPTSSSVRP